MPVIKSAQKKMRQDKKRTLRNKEIKEGIRRLTKTVRRTPEKENFQQLQSVLDKAVKTNFIHANKAARLKSRLNKLMATPAK